MCHSKANRHSLPMRDQRTRSLRLALPRRPPHSRKRPLDAINGGQEFAQRGNGRPNASPKGDPSAGQEFAMGGEWSGWTERPSRNSDDAQYRTDVQASSTKIGAEREGKATETMQPPISSQAGTAHFAPWPASGDEVAVVMPQGCAAADCGTASTSVPARKPRTANRAARRFKCFVTSTHHGLKMRPRHRRENPSSCTARPDSINVGRKAVTPIGSWLT